MSTPVFRYLKGYTIDPGFSTQLDTMGINEMTYRIRWEYLQPGPIGEYVEVIDFDPSANYFYDPVDLDSKDLLSQHGLTPNEGNAQFHQQFVYTIVMQTIGHFEKALGRKIIWRRKAQKDEKGIFRKEEYIQRLRVYPHAMRDANAFYSEEKLALLFGYFEAGSRIQGSNFPGGVIFTCLSPDIIAHETTHAILDSIHPRYLENTNPDVPAFHEAFADIVALLQRFANKKLVEHQLERTRGRLDEYSILGELATQFGQALESGRGALRSAIGRYDKKSGKWKKINPDPSAYQNVFEPHQRGAILVATVFDAFMRLYNFRTQDLLRIATQGTGVLPQGAIHPDLVKRLGQEASEIALYLLSVCIRALDYCPPFDITFGNYLRALITADVDLCPADENGYRVALIEAFRAWGIFPDRVNTLSIYSLKWDSPQLKSKEKTAMKFLTDYLRNEIQSLLRLEKRKDISTAYSSLQARLHNFIMYPDKISPIEWKKNKLKKETWTSFLKELGISFDTVMLKYKDDDEDSIKDKDGYTTIEFTKDVPLEVHSVRPAFRQGREEKQLEQVIISFTQTIKVPKGRKFEGLRFRGGSTVILSLSENNLNADYIIVKNINSRKRLKEQIDYQTRRTSGASLTESIYESDEGFNNISFEKLHFH